MFPTVRLNGGRTYLVMLRPFLSFELSFKLLLIRVPSTFALYLLQFYCSNDKEYNDLATIFFNTQVR